VYVGETQVTAALAAVLWSTLPLFSAVIAARLLADEPLTRLKLVGIRHRRRRARRRLSRRARR
jgi:drug/metabolite transporter (DMT)-like permease